MGGRLDSRATFAAALSVALAACKEPEKPKASALAEIASASLAVRPTVPASAAPAAPSEPVVRRPSGPADVLLTAERRKRVEAFAPKASGFLTSAEIEERLYAMALPRGKDAAAASALDGIAKGKWVLFTGNIGGISPDGFELPVRYTPRDPNDPMGLTAVWLPIRFSAIEGYDPKAYRPGELAVVLARYEGGQKASSGHDLVLLGMWFEAR